MAGFESEGPRAVLYIEDSRADAELARTVLASVGVDVQVVRNVDEEVEKRIRRSEYAALLVDHLLEGARGVDIVAELKEKGVKLPPTYVVSGSAESDLDLRAIWSGADGFIAKGSRQYRQQLLAAVGVDPR